MRSLLGVGWTRWLILALVTELPGLAVAQNLVRNGDLEKVASTGCSFNLTNAQFNATVANATAFGSGEEIDLMRGPGGCGFASSPFSGVTKAGISTAAVGSSSDAFSFDLTGAIVPGETYTLQFSVEAWTALPGLDVGSVQVGLSTSATSFGTLIFSGTGSTGAWTTFTDTFVAPVGGSFLTVRNDPDKLSWNHVDNFSLLAGSCEPQLGFQGPGTAQASLCGTGLSAGQSSDYEVVGAPALSAGGLFVSFDGGSNVSIAGGTLVSFSNFAGAVPLQASAAGTYDLTVTGLPVVADLVFQSVFVDPSQPSSLAFTNAVLARFGR